MFVFRKKTIPDLATFSTYFQYYLHFFSRETIPWSRIPLTNFMPLVSFYTPWKHKKSFDFLLFSGGIETDQWLEMSQYS